MTGTTYQRPVKATLYVHLDNGEQFEAATEDLANFGYVKRLDAYTAFDDRLRDILHAAGLIRRETTESRINVIRHLVEVAINYPNLLDHREMQPEYAEIVRIEQVLREHMPEDES